MLRLTEPRSEFFAAGEDSDGVQCNGCAADIRRRVWTCPRRFANSTFFLRPPIAGTVTKSLDPVAQASAPASSRTVPERESEPRGSRPEESGSGTLPELAAGTAALPCPATLALALPPIAGRIQGPADTGARTALSARKIK